MNKVLIGSDLTRVMLENGCQDIWCAVDDNSDEDAMRDQIENDFTARIVSCDNEKFYCTAGMAWLCAVPIKVLPMTLSDVKFEIS
ncbi:hypothetical protein IPZ60_01250 [Psychrobacter sp. NG25]|nr:hypothetical protein [Psychrobacter sp. NG25]